MMEEAKIMKNKIFQVLPVFIFMLILGSCVTPITFDESLPEDNYAFIHWNNILEISEFNGIAVNWKPRAALGFGSLELKIPGGDTRFVLNGRVGSYNMGYTTYRNVPFVFNFENGKEYTLLVGQNFIYIYNGKSTSMKEHIVTYNMNNGQKAIYEYGKKVQ
jgi:hypothetical protein